MPRKRQNRVSDPEDDLVIRTMAVGYSSGYTIPEHTHEWNQLIFASTGVMTVRTPQGCWVVPTQRAVWVPAGVGHSIEMSGWVSFRSLYVPNGLSKALPKDCSVVNVSPLLRELILHATSLGALNRTVPSQARLIGVLLDQLEVSRAMPLQLPMPRDPRARKIAERLYTNPSECNALQELSRAAGASKRTIERLFASETRMTFSRWRQQARLLHALRLLAAGQPVTNVAFEVGYESPSAFISVFKRVIGSTPSRYAAVRLVE